MSKSLVVFMLTCILGVATTALAGDVTGTGPDGGIVVWLEGSLSREVPKPISIAQRGVKFSPELAVAVVGQTVSFPNEDNVAHNVYSSSATKKLNLGVYEKGETRSMAFDTA
ncbi:MAG: hypothetical protein ABI837_17090, partial [Acidobacteriota bacterium]